VTDVLPTSIGEQQDLETQLRDAKEAIAGPVPLIEPAPDTYVDLPRGLNYNGQTFRRAEVRELTGVDEEALSKCKKIEDTFDTVLTRGVIQIGDLALEDLPMAERQGYLRNLLIGERDLLAMAVAKVTYGDTRLFPYVCTLCNYKQDLKVSITDDIKMKGGEDVASARSFDFTTSRGLVLKYRLATGVDQMEVLSRDLSSAEQNTLILSNCIQSVGGGPVVDPMNFARSLSMRDRQSLLKEMVERQPSLTWEVDFPCLGCGEEQQASLGWPDFFRP
jgi:hypothetical protein